SRRRHTRLVSDWSSDVCSSDLNAQRSGRIEADSREPPKVVRTHSVAIGRFVDVGQATLVDIAPGKQAAVGIARQTLAFGFVGQRSEERRVGKECRSGWEAEQCK